MERPSYSSAKRYSDNISTMWFSFFYAPILPIGPVISIVGLLIYYYVVNDFKYYIFILYKFKIRINIISLENAQLKFQ